MTYRWPNIKCVCDDKCSVKTVFRSLVFTQWYKLRLFFNPLPHNLTFWFLTTMEKNTFENIVRKGENAGHQHFLLFSQCFLFFQAQFPVLELSLKCRLQNTFILDHQDFCCSVKSYEIIYINPTHCLPSCSEVKGQGEGDLYQSCVKFRKCW